MQVIGIQKAWKVLKRKRQVKELEFKMAKTIRITEVLQNVPVLLWIHRRSGHKSSRTKFSLFIKKCKVSKTNGIFHILEFKDPFNGRKAKIRKSQGNYRILDLTKDDYGIKGFERFTDKKKRKVWPKKVVPLQKHQDIQLMQAQLIEQYYLQAGLQGKPAYRFGLVVNDGPIGPVGIIGPPGDPGTYGVRMPEFSETNMFKIHPEPADKIGKIINQERSISRDGKIVQTVTTTVHETK
jgi:hypothetical protein